MERKQKDKWIIAMEYKIKLYVRKKTNDVIYLCPSCNKKITIEYKDYPDFEFGKIDCSDCGKKLIIKKVIWI